MAIEKGGRSIRGIRYDGEGIGRAIILKAFYDDPDLGRVVVWDGRISETVPVPAIPFTVSAPAPEVLADATVEGADITYWLSPPVVSVSAGSSPVGEPVEYDLEVESPSALSGSHNIEAPAFEYGVELEGGVVASAIGGEFVDPMHYTVDTPGPAVRGDANVTAPTMLFYLEPVAPDGVGAFADVDGGTIEYAVEVVAPSTVTASSAAAGAAPSIVVAPVAPSLSASSAASGQPISYTLALVPGEGVSATLTRQRINKAGTLTGFEYTAVPGWVSDGTYPGTVATGNDGLSVVGAGTKVYVRMSLTSTRGVNGTASLQVNGSTVGNSWWTNSASASETTSSAQYSLDLSHADKVSIITTKSDTNSGVVSGGYIEVLPPIGTPTFDAVASAQGSSSTVSTTLTTVAASTTVLVALEATVNTVKVDGVDATLIPGTRLDTRQVYYLQGVSAGSHTVTVNNTGFGARFVTASYSNVTAVGNGNNLAASFGSTRTITADYIGGPGQVAFYVFNGTLTGAAATTTDATARGRLDSTGDSSKSMIVADSTSSSATVTVASSQNIAARTVWLY